MVVPITVKKSAVIIVVMVQAMVLHVIDFIVLIARLFVCFCVLDLDFGPRPRPRIVWKHVSLFVENDVLSIF